MWGIPTWMWVLLGELASPYRGQSLLAPPPSQPGHGDVTWNQPRSRVWKLEWLTQNRGNRGEIMLAVVETTTVTADFQEQQGRQDGGAGSADLFLVAHQWPPQQTVPKAWFCLWSWLSSLHVNLARMSSGPRWDWACITTHCLQQRGWKQR